MKYYKTILLFVISFFLTLLIQYNISCKKNETENPSGKDSTKYSISGKITDSTNNAITDVTVVLSGPVSDTVKPDMNGNYLFSALVKGDYIIKPSKTDYFFTPISRSVKITKANVIGQDFIGSMQLSYSISGNIKDSTNTGILNVSIILSGPVSYTLKPDDNGIYVFTNLVKGDYTINLSKTGYSFSPLKRSVKINNTNITGQDFVMLIPESMHFIDIPTTILSGVNGEIDNTTHKLRITGMANPSTSRYVFFNSDPLPINDLKTAIFEADITLKTGLRTGLLNSSDPCGDRSDNSLGTPVLFRIWFTWNTFTEISMQSTFGFNLEQVINALQPVTISQNGGIARPCSRISNWTGEPAEFDPLGLIQLSSVGVQYHVRLSVDLQQNKVMAEMQPKTSFEDRFKPFPPGTDDAVAAPFVAVTNLVDYTNDLIFDSTLFWGIAIRTNGNTDYDDPSAPGGSLRYIEREFSNVKITFNKSISFPAVPKLTIPSDDFNDGNFSLYWEFYPTDGLSYLEQNGTLNLFGTPEEDGTAFFTNLSVQRQDIATSIDFKAPTGIQNNTLCIFRIQFDGFNYINLQIDPNGGYYLVRFINNQVNEIGTSLPLFGDETMDFHRLKLSYNNTSGHTEAFVDDVQLGGIEDYLFSSSYSNLQVVFYSFVIKDKSILREWDNFTFVGSDQ